VDQACAYGSRQSTSGENGSHFFCETNPILSVANEAALRGTLRSTSAAFIEENGAVPTS
jgi:hypothetical protein